MYLYVIYDPRSDCFFPTCMYYFSGDGPVVTPLKKFVAVHPGDSVDDGCTVTHSVQNSITYSRVDGALPKHHVLPNGDIVFRFESLTDSGEYQCQAITEKGTYVASFYGKMFYSSV